MGMRKLSATEAQDLCEILEERSIAKSTIFTTQLPLDHWSEVIADPVIADAIRDRLQHSALTINITGVKSDLVSIASAERRYFATEGKYATLDELISTNYVSVAHQRPPYSYDIQTGGGGFHVIATRSGDDTSGTPAQLSVDENMEFQSSQ